MYQHIVVVCECLHQKREHLSTKRRPHGPCTTCGCAGFTPERQCAVPKCGHGAKAHRRGRCHECGCTEFQPLPLSNCAQKGQYL